MILFACTIPGRCYVKKNGAKRVGRGKNTRMIYTRNYTAWAADAILELKQAWKGQNPIECEIEATFKFYFKDKQAEADTSNLCEAPADALTDAGIIKDDILIYKLIAEKYFYTDQKVEIEIRRYKND